MGVKGSEMGQFEFDAKKIINVPTNRVTPNGWNPKEKDTREYQRVRDSVKKKGLRGTIVVRNHPHQEGYYEIIDGEQRWTAATELGIPNVNVYNEGDIEEKEAKELTIWYQQQVPFHRITEAYLVTGLVDEFGLEEIELPYSEAEIEEFKELADFNFDQYNQDGHKENDDGTVTLSFRLSKEDHHRVKEALEEFASENSCNENEALIGLVLGE